MKYAISAATGHLGQLVIQHLLKLVPATDVVAIVRNPDKAKQVLSADIEIRQADYTDVTALTNALAHVDRLLFISSIPGTATPRQVQHQNVVQAAQAANVHYIAYTSFAKAETAQSPLSADHIATEKMIKASGIAYSFLRNAWYLENESSYLKAALAGEDAVYAAGDGQMSFALEREYGEAAAKVLASSTTKAIYEFGGQPSSYADLQTALHQVLDTDFQFKAVSDDDYRQTMLSAGLDAQFVEVLLAMQVMMRHNELNVPTTDLADVLGRPVTSLVDAVKEVLNTLN